jgi:hypothetical protein
MSAEPEEGTAPAEPTWPRVVKLKHPIQFGQQLIASLEFRRGRLGDFKGMKVGTMPTADQLILLASRLSGQPVAALELLDSDDAEEVMGVAFLFFTKCLPGGMTP